MFKQLGTWYCPEKKQINMISLSYSDSFSLKKNKNKKDYVRMEKMRAMIKLSLTQLQECVWHGGEPIAGCIVPRRDRQ